MKKLVLVFSILSAIAFAEILDPSFGALKISGDGWMSVGWNCAGISSAEDDFIYVDVVYRTNGFLDMKSFSLEYVQARNQERALAGSLGVYRVFSGYDMERLGLVYKISGANSGTNWGVGIGIERVRDEMSPDGFYSAFLEVGFLGKLSENLEYAFSLRKIRLWSERLDSYLLGDFGVSIGYKTKLLDISSGVLMYEAEYIRPFLGIDLKFDWGGLGLGGEMVFRWSDYSFTPRLEGSLYFEKSPLTFGVYGGYMFETFSDTGIEREMIMDTVLALFTKVNL